MHIAWRQMIYKWHNCYKALQCDAPAVGIIMWLTKEQEENLI